MNPVRKIEMQCTHAEFFRELPLACRDHQYDLVGDSVIVHDGGREVHINARDEPIRHLGSLDLPTEELTLKFIDYSDEQVDTFMAEFLKPIMRAGGG